MTEPVPPAESAMSPHRPDAATAQRQVMVAAASRHGATWQIALAIAAGLSDYDVPAEAFRLGDEIDDPTPEDYAGFVIGSAVYAGHWMTPALRLIAQHRTLLRSRPVWLFSSGLIGAEHFPADHEAVRVDALLADTAAREHRLFGGRLVRSELSLPERALIIGLRVSDTDSRDFPAIVAWSHQIARTMREPAHDRAHHEMRTR